MANAQNFSKAEHACAAGHGTLLTLNIFSQQEAQTVQEYLLQSGKN